MNTRTFCELLENRRLLANTYYFSPFGSDLNLGSSPASAWRSISKLNALDLEPGDQVLLEGGSTFADPDVPVDLVNPGFESGIVGWDVDYGNAQVLPGIGHSGLRALRVNAGEGGMGQTITSLVQPNTTYTFAAWGRVSNPAEWGYVAISFRDEFGSTIGGTQLVVTGTNYSRFSGSFVSPPSFASCDIWTYKFIGTTGSFFLDVDDFSLVQNTNTIFMDAADSGSAENPVTIGSWGSGRATIGANTGQGLFAYNAGGIRIQDVDFVGAGLSANRSNGISFLTDAPGDAKLDYLRVENVDVSGFGDTGITIGGWFDSFSTSGYRDVRVSNAHVHDIGRYGIHVWGPSLYSHENVTITDSRVHAVSGGNGGPGDGIVIGSTNGGIVQRCIVYENGALGLGPIGVRTYNSSNQVIQFNEAYNNRTASVIDGGGFALDWGTTNSVLQYNYSHGNDGSGYLLSGRSGLAPTGGNTIRYNISENDGRKNSYAGIHVWNQSVAIGSSHIYNNTVYISPAQTGSPKGIWLQVPNPYLAPAVTEVSFCNNIVFAADGARLIESAAGEAGITFQGNNYWSSNGSFQFAWAGTVYTSLAAWRSATGQEHDGVNELGMTVDPMFASPGGGGTVGDPGLLASVAAYRTLSGSLVRDTAMDLFSRYGINPGTRDYYGGAIPQGAGFDLGAHEASAAAGITPPTISFGYQTRHEIIVTFAEDVAATIELSDLVLTDVSTGQALSPGMTLEINGAPGAPTTATWVLLSPLPNGYYRGTLNAGSVADTTGGTLSESVGHSFSSWPVTPIVTSLLISTIYTSSPAIGSATTRSSGRAISTTTASWTTSTWGSSR